MGEEKTCRHGFYPDQCGHCADANDSYERNRGVELCLEASEEYVKDLEQENKDLSQQRDDLLEAANNFILAVEDHKASGGSAAQALYRMDRELIERSLYALSKAISKSRPSEFDFAAGAS